MLPATTDVAGTLTWSPDVEESVETSVSGDLANIVNNATTGGMPATGMYTIDPGGQLVWDASSVVEDDAQVIAYLSVNGAKEYVRANMDPDLSILDQQLLVNVNIAQDCNAFFDGANLNFFHLTSACENTARIQDVVYHEFGHDVHANEIIPGVGSFDQAMSEGIADFLAATITGDHGMGRGFDFTDNPLRDIDPDGFEYKWPDDIGEVHHTGLIISGAFWDLRKQLITELGTDDALALVAKLYIGALRRSVDIPSTLIEVLATDDDDGDLSNGTPHECEIRNAWATHGLRTVTGTLDAPGALADLEASTAVALDLDGLSSRCGGDTIDHVQLSWSAIYERLTGSAVATAASAFQFVGEVPLVPHSTMSYTFDVELHRRHDAHARRQSRRPLVPDVHRRDGRALLHRLREHRSVPGRLDRRRRARYARSLAMGHADVGHDRSTRRVLRLDVLALALNGDYLASDHAWLKSPVVQVGQYSDVRLQYRRWLAVEDGYFDQAAISVNGTSVWTNFNSNQGTSSTTDHIDKEWRFQDVQLAGYYFAHSVQIGWDLVSDGGLELGGWTLDDVCIVANPESICGDGIKSITEECDDGSANADAPDKCRTYCRTPRCGDGIVDTGEECDDGPTGSATCTSKCTAIPTDGGGGCGCTTGGDRRGWLAIAFVVLIARRRRRIQ